VPVESQNSSLTHFMVAGHSVMSREAAGEGSAGEEDPAEEEVEEESEEEQHTPPVHGKDSVLLS